MPVRPAHAAISPLVRTVSLRWTFPPAPRQPDRWRPATTLQSRGEPVQTGESTTPLERDGECRQPRDSWARECWSSRRRRFLGHPRRGLGWSSKRICGIPTGMPRSLGVAAHNAWRLRTKSASAGPYPVKSSPWPIRSRTAHTWLKASSIWPGQSVPALHADRQAEKRI